MEALCIILIIELIINLSYFKWDFTNPSIIFNLMFVVASFDLLLMSDYWGVVIKKETITVITVGVLSFFLAAVLADKIKTKKVSSNSISLINSHISNTRFLIYIFLYLVTLIAVVIYRIKSVGISYTMGSLLSSYSEAMGIDDAVNLPIALKLLSLFCTSMAYIIAYLFADYWIKEKKVNKRLLVLLLICGVFLLFTQKRGNFIVFIINLFCQLLLHSKVFKAKKIKRKLYFYITIGAILIIISFNSIASIMGRSFGEDNPLALFSVYLGGPILNLNSVINNMPSKSNLFLSETFHSFYQSIYKYTGIEALNYDTTRIFRSSLSHATGNVYTTFYDFYYDGGIAGVIILTFLMSFVVCRFYKAIRLGRYRNRMFGFVLYSYFYALIWRSFFANSFYEWIQLSTLETLLVWFIASYILSGRVKFKNGKLSISRR